MNILGRHLNKGIVHYNYYFRAHLLLLRYLYLVIYFLYFYCIYSALDSLLFILFPNTVALVLLCCSLVVLCCMFVPCPASHLVYQQKRTTNIN